MTKLADPSNKLNWWPDESKLLFHKLNELKPPQIFFDPEVVHLITNVKYLKMC